MKDSLRRTIAFTVFLTIVPALVATGVGYIIYLIQ
jgi:hypothetical protein